MAAVLVTVQLIFGGYAIVVKMAMSEHVDALVFSLYRDIGASVVLLGACTLMGERKPVPAGDRLLFVGVGLFGITITQTAFVLALQWVPAFNASLMQPSIPVLTLLLALCLRLEVLHVRSAAGALKLAGILIGCAGAASVSNVPSYQCHSSLPWLPGAGRPGPWPRDALRTSRQAAQGPTEGCGAAVRLGRGRRPSVVPHPGATYTVLSAADQHPSGAGGGDSGGVSGDAPLFGNALLVLQCIGGAVFQLMNKQLTGRYASITVAAYGYSVGTLLLLALVAPRLGGRSRHAPPCAVGMRGASTREGAPARAGACSPVLVPVQLGDREC